MVVRLPYLTCYTYTNKTIIMFEPKRILVPRATLSKSGGMAELALEFAGRFDAEVFLLRVDLDSVAGFENYLWSLSADEAGNREAAEPEAGSDDDSGRTDLHLEHAGTQPAVTAIIDFTLLHEIDLIMIAAHTHSVLGKRVFGGVQLEVLRWAPCTVLTGRRERAAALAEKPIEKILVPVDFSEHAARALQVAGVIADRYGAELCALHVHEERIIPRFSDKGVSHAVLPSDQDYPEDADEALRSFVKEHSTSNTKTTCFTERGYIGAKTASTATKIGADLVIISAKGLTNDPDVELGRAADRIVRRAPCPVLTLK